ncbi:TetR/AcrR family transcriptional regulator [Sulfurimonas sp.]
MAIIVDKVQKKKNIALACKNIILKKGLQNLTVAEMAKEADVGKGTIYEYFRSKEEVVFELALQLMQEHAHSLEKNILNKTTTRQKIKEFASFFYKKEYFELREIYKQFVALALLYPKEEILEFNAKSIQEYATWFHKLLEEGVDKGELKVEILHFSDGLFAIGDGLFIQSSVTDKLEILQTKLETYIDTIFDLMEIKK